MPGAHPSWVNLHLQQRGCFFTMQTHLYNLAVQVAEPREVAESPPWEIFQSCLVVVLSNLSRGWTRRPPEGLSHLCCSPESPRRAHANQIDVPSPWAASWLLLSAPCAARAPRLAHHSCVGLQVLPCPSQPACPALLHHSGVTCIRLLPHSFHISQKDSSQLLLGGDKPDSQGLAFFEERWMFLKVIIFLALTFIVL